MCKTLLKIAAVSVAIFLSGQVQAQETGADMPAPLPPAPSFPAISPPPVTQEFMPQEQLQQVPQPLLPEIEPVIEAAPSPLPAPPPSITPPVLSSPTLPVPSPSTSEFREEQVPPAENNTAIPSPLLTPIPSMNRNLPQDLSPYGMFMQADIIVQSVMVGLLIASALTWAIWLAKFVEIAMAKQRTRRAVKALISSRSLAEAIEKFQDKKGVSARLIMAAAGEVRLSLGAVDGAGVEGMKERVASHLARIEVRCGRIISRGTGILASIGSVAPFVGLFGTVWGIMNAFIGISYAQTTNLAVVAPGIAEALLATAMGLFAAIPAVVIYNILARSITVYRQMLADISAAIERLISRDLDFRLAHSKAGRPILTTGRE